MSELLEKLANLEHEQWIGWTKGLSDDYSRLIGLIDLEMLSGDDFEFVVSQLDRLDRWKCLGSTSYDDLSEEYKEEDRVYARKVMDLILR